ncbi:class I SAM-dependent methyltransferase [Denitromonas iodatirespirans]|uniref:Class I SAM-dependent methyltransferase n=1 Tax=Denitromonas iodatirespirans TaxID=2795389 RepID=A0A944HAZ4_DENI1|nr:class I SAM-dependent methyltransferase [Denitromonas iodatirespirans]MBT0963985.1 class I SAM-dependent methyltransferase [Denitromonas iodatirespirans]
MKNKRYSGNRAVILDFLPDTFETLLDVGCAAGEFGSVVRTASGAEVWGVEPMSEAALRAKSKLDNVVNDFFDLNAPIPEAYFDVVTFNDSLEHFPEPISPLRLAKQKLKPSGTLVCCVPNVRYIENVKNLLFEKDWKYTERGILDDTHLRFFTKKSLERTIDEAGFSIKKIEGINPYWDSGRRTRVLLPLLGRWAEDMKYFQFVVVAEPTR